MKRLPILAGIARSSLTLAMMLGIVFTTVCCSPGQDQAPQRRPDKLFIGCNEPLSVPGGRTITHFSHDEDQAGRLQGLFFEISDPSVAPAIDGNSSTSYRAEPISEAGAELVRRNVKQPGKPANYLGMSETDQMSIHLAVFGGRAIQFDNQAGYGKLSEENILPTDDVLFLEPGWAIGVIVPKEKVALAPAFRASASVALKVLLSLQRGCSSPTP
jgi:hypothetical protein